MCLENAPILANSQRKNTAGLVVGTTATAALHPTSELDGGNEGQTTVAVEAMIMSGAGTGVEMMTDGFASCLQASLQRTAAFTAGRPSCFRLPATAPMTRMAVFPIGMTIPVASTSHGYSLKVLRVRAAFSSQRSPSTSFLSLYFLLPSRRGVSPLRKLGLKSRTRRRRRSRRDFQKLTLAGLIVFYGLTWISFLIR